MAFYQCKVINLKGVKSEMTIEADNEEVLKAKIKLSDNILISSRLLKEKKQSTFFAVSSRVKPVEVVLFLRQFSVMINSGATISDSLFSLKNQKHSAMFTRVLQDVYDDVISGVLLSSAFSKHPKVFPEYFQNMIAIGEATGSLEKVLKSLADYYENDRKIKSKAASSMVYPIILMIMIVVLVAFMTLFIIPQFESMIDELGGNVPLITKIIMSISRFMQNNILYIAICIAVLVIDSRIFFSTKKGKIVKDSIILKIPIIGTVQKEVITSRFAKAFIILLDSGMNISECMTNLKRMLGNESLRKKFDSIIDMVSHGESISASLKTLHFFPEVLIDMIAVGEKSGNLEEVLRSTSDYFDQRVESAITKATNSIEPITIVSLGVVVGIVILAIYLPMINLMQSINQ